MLTPEQIQKLKPGDPLVVQCEFHKVYNNGDITVKHNVLLNGEDRYIHTYTHPSCASLPSEIVNSQSSIVNKYDPTRLFKKGDVVTPRIYLGRKDKGLEMGEKYIVTADEIAGDMVAIKHHFTLRPDIVQTCFLELVTPVEELEPYHIQKAAEFDAWHICNRNNDVIFHFNPDPCNLMMDMTEIEKLARAQCDYLNERFRDLIGKAAPVEELEPYRVGESSLTWYVYKDDDVVVSFVKEKHPNAKAAAEAECDRLNAEWRKEQK